MMSTQISIYMLQIRRLDKLDLAFFCSNQPPKDVFRKLWSPFVLSSSTLSMSSQTEWTPSSSKSTPTWTSPAPLCPFRIFRYGKDRGGGLHRGCRKEPQSFSRSVQFHLQSFVLWNETPGLSSANPFWVFISLDTGLLWIHEGGLEQLWTFMDGWLQVCRSCDLCQVFYWPFHNLLMLFS